MKQINKFIILIKVMFNNLILSIRYRYFYRVVSNITLSYSFILPLILSKLNLSDADGVG